MAIENTDLERRVLAHERILQTLIARLATSDPQLMDHLNGLFGAPLATDQHEHLPAQPPGPTRGQAAPEETQAKALGPTASVSAMLRVRHRHGIWQVTRDREHYGDYCAEGAARAAASQAVQKIVAHGGSAEIC
jgi:hypothetical protein